MFTGLAACFAAALSGAAAKLGIAVNVGSIIANTINGTVRPALRGRISDAVKQHQPATVALKEQRIEEWADLLVNGLCHGVTIMCVRQYERIMFTAANALTGAEIMTTQVCKFAESKGVPLQNSPFVTMLQYSLFVGGFYSQINPFIGNGQLPWALRLVLFGPLLLERTLGWSAAAARTQTGIFA